MCIWLWQIWSTGCVVDHISTVYFFGSVSLGPSIGTDHCGSRWTVPCHNKEKVFFFFCSCSFRPFFVFVLLLFFIPPPHPSSLPREKGLTWQRVGLNYPWFWLGSFVKFLSTLAQKMKKKKEHPLHADLFLILSTYSIYTAHCSYVVDRMLQSNY